MAEAENKDLSSRLESLESIVRMLELKHKNSLEHASRLEEREGDLKKEYAKLHDRYTELFKTHVDYMERTKLLMGSTHSQLNSTSSERVELNRSRLHPMYRSSGPVSFGFQTFDTSQMMDSETICSANCSEASSGMRIHMDSNCNARSNLSNLLVKLAQDRRRYKTKSRMCKRWSVQPKRIH